LPLPFSFLPQLIPLPLLSLGLGVALDEELGEKDEEGEDVDEVNLGDDLGGVLDVVHEEVGGLAHHADELDHLLHGEDGLPPD